MLTLIGREIRDHAVYFIGLWLATVTMIAVLVLAVHEGMESGYGAPLVLLAFVMLVGHCSLGSAQMYADRANRISPLLSTLAVTRSRILAAKVLVGILAVLVSLVPVVVTVTVLLSVFVPPLAFYRRMLIEISATAILTGLACHVVGLMVGWTTSKAWLMAGTLVPILLLMSLILIKGFGLDTLALLLVFIGAALWRVWQTFTSVSL